MKLLYWVIYRPTGEVISRHATRAAAERAADKVSSSIARYVGVEYVGPWEVK